LVGRVGIGSKVGDEEVALGKEILTTKTRKKKMELWIFGIME
jgi:hypothetical protein